MKKIFFFFHILLLDMCFAQSPGGVSGVSVWFKTNSAQTPALIYQDYSGNQNEIKAISLQTDLIIHYLIIMKVWILME